MAEYEVNAHLEGETDIEIPTIFLSWREKFNLICRILQGKLICANVWVELEGECYVEIEPQDRY